MSNNAPDYENDLVFAPSMPRCDIDELKAKLEQSEKMRDLQAEYACKLEKKLEIAVKALEKMVNYNSVAEQVDKYYYIVLDVREIGKKALKEIKE